MLQIHNFSVFVIEMVHVPVIFPQKIHFIDQGWNILKSHFRSNFQQNLKQNSYIFIHENALENLIWEMETILSRPQCVNKESSQQHLYSQKTQ